MRSQVICEFVEGWCCSRCLCSVLFFLLRTPQQFGKFLLLFCAHAHSDCGSTWRRPTCHWAATTAPPAASSVPPRMRSKFTSLGSTDLCNNNTKCVRLFDQINSNKMFLAFFIPISLELKHNARCFCKCVTDFFYLALIPFTLVTIRKSTHFRVYNVTPCEN